MVTVSQRELCGNRDSERSWVPSGKGLIKSALQMIQQSIKLVNRPSTSQHTSGYVRCPCRGHGILCDGNKVMSWILTCWLCRQLIHIVWAFSTLYVHVPVCDTDWHWIQFSVVEFCRDQQDSHIRHVFQCVLIWEFSILIPDSTLLMEHGVRNWCWPLQTQYTVFIEIDAHAQIDAHPLHHEALDT